MFNQLLLVTFSSPLDTYFIGHAIMQNNKRQPQSTVTDGGIPIWDIQRIKVTLDSCDIPVSLEDIMKPNVNSATAVFQGLLEVIMGIAAEDIEYSKGSLLPTMKQRVSRGVRAVREKADGDRI